MKTMMFAAAVALMAAFTMGTQPADAAGCLKGAAVGGVAGHVAGGHGLLGAGAGCVVGRHEANKSARNQASQAQNANSQGQGGNGSDNSNQR